MELGQFKENGYALIKGVFTKKENKLFREISDKYFANYPSLDFSNGRCLSGYSNITPELEEINTLHKSKKILNLVESILGENYIFAEHSDLHQNKTTPWHRDILMGPYVLYQQRNPWHEEYKIIKVLALLQDHSDNDHGLWVVPKSHDKQDDHPNVKDEGEHCIHSEVGDVIVFDQRILHRGQQGPSTYEEEYNRSRYLITYGYGVDNIYTQQHMRGTIARQQDQRRRLSAP